MQRRARALGQAAWPPCWALWMPRWSLGIASIGGKDSMSGTFEDLDVPPTLVSFAIATAKTRDVLISRVQGSRQRRCYAASPSTTRTACPRLAA